MKLTKRKDGRYCRTVTIDGKKIYFYSSKPNAKQAEKDIENQLIEFQGKKEKGKSFEAVAEEWNRQYRERISDITYNKTASAAYGKVLKHFKSYNNINDIKLKDINSFIYKLIKMNLSKKTVANHKSILNMIMQHAVYEGYIEYNPVKDIKLPSNLPQSVRELPSDEEIKIVSHHWEGFDFFAYLILYTGLRRSEALALTYEDIDKDNKMITVNKRLIHNGNKPVIEYKTKTENSKRTVVLLDRVAEKLSSGKGLIFVNSEGEPLTKRQFSNRWESYCKKYNLTLTPHQLRHAYATMLYEAGIDVKDAQNLMGHSDINLTRQIYTHIRDKRLDDTRNKLNSFAF